MNRAATPCPARGYPRSRSNTPACRTSAVDLTQVLRRGSEVEKRPSCRIDVRVRSPELSVAERMAAGICRRRLTRHACRATSLSLRRATTVISRSSVSYPWLVHIQNEERYAVARVCVWLPDHVVLSSPVCSSSSSSSTVQPLPSPRPSPVAPKCSSQRVVRAFIRRTRG